MRMAKTGEAVATFLADLASKMAPLGEAEIKEMLELKEQEVM